MKRAFIVILLLLAVVLATPFFALGPAGGPLLEPWHLTHPKAALDRIRARLGAHETMIYKWRDPAGEWVYGASPPPGVEAEPIAVHSETNVVPATPARAD